MKFNIVLALSSIFLFGCASVNHRQPTLLPKNEILTVIDDKIFQGTIPIAELRCFGKGTDSCKGLAIFYYQLNKEIWIFPKEGWNITNLSNKKTFSTVYEINEQLRLAMTTTFDGKLITDFTKVVLRRGKRNISDLKFYETAFDIKISGDGKYVFFKSRGVFFNHTHRFSVEHGALD